MSDSIEVTGRVTRLERKPQASGDFVPYANSLLFRIESDSDPRHFALELSDEISVRILLFAAHHGIPIRIHGRSIDAHFKQVMELSVELLPESK